MNEPYCCEFDKLLSECVKSGLEDCYFEDGFNGKRFYVGIAKFNNGVHFKFWNCNLFYGWLTCDNSFYRPTSNVIQFGRHARPSRLTMLKFFDQIEPYHIDAVLNHRDLEIGSDAIERILDIKIDGCK